MPSPHDKYRTFWQRFFAGVVDGLILRPVGWLFSLVYDRALGGGVTLTVWCLELAVGVAYSVLLHARYGQTLGKMALDIKVVDVSEAPIRYHQAVLRDLPMILFTAAMMGAAAPAVWSGAHPHSPAAQTASMMWLGMGSLIWLGIELLTMFTNEKRRAIHDFIAGTVVVKVEYLAARPAGD